MSNINNVNNQQNNYSNYNSTSKNDKTAKSTAASSTATSTAAAADQITDEVELSSSKAGTNKVYTRDSVRANELKQITQQNLQTLKSMVDKLLSNQGKVSSGLQSSSSSFSFSFDFSYSMLSANSQAGSFNAESFSFNLGFSAESVNSNGYVEIDDATRAEAEAMIGEDGPLGAKQVSQNILDFAKAISGGDPSKIQVLKDAFLKGFNEVAKMFGGKDKMPEVSRKTYDLVMQGFDAWANEGASTAAEDE